MDLWCGLRRREPSRETSRIYNKLNYLHRDLNEIYGPTMLYVILFILLSNSMVGYIGLLKLMLPNFNGTHYEYLFGNEFYCLIIIHWYIYFMICHDMETTIEEIDLILNGYAAKDENRQQEVGIAPLSLQKNIYISKTFPYFQLELIVFSGYLHKFSVNFCGLIVVNWSTLFCILAQTVSYIITLIKLDYVNLI